MKCTKCGAENIDNAKFCNGCGDVVNSEKNLIKYPNEINDSNGLQKTARNVARMVLVILAVIIVACFVVLKSSVSNKEELIIGKWRFNGKYHDVVFVFGEDGKGCVEDFDYWSGFDYKIKHNNLYLSNFSGEYLRSDYLNSDDPIEFSLTKHILTLKTEEE
ncbi:MAG: zinc-ribbon domain-containing protein, partial [Oscillospiraceae bacterium]|nr:zinc-ribbon domain-containing protein [Oscillospiraceae bacterium]